jgi:hypothetical protein
MGIGSRLRPSTARERAPESSRPAPPGDPVWPPPPEEDPYRMPSQQQVQQQASDAAVSWAKENPKDAMKLAKAASRAARGVGFEASHGRSIKLTGSTPTRLRPQAVGLHNKGAGPLRLG